MTHEFVLSDDELGVVRRALERELETSRVELHHTRSLDYREVVKSQIQMLEHMIQVTFSGTHVVA